MQFEQILTFSGKIFKLLVLSRAEKAVLKAPWFRSGYLFMAAMNFKGFSVETVLHLVCYPSTFAV